MRCSSCYADISANVFSHACDGRRAITPLISHPVDEKHTRLEAENKRLREALMKIAVAEGREGYPQELWGAYLMDLARAALKNE